VTERYSHGVFIVKKHVLQKSSKSRH
jgi:hypothetical protein